MILARVVLLAEKWKVQNPEFKKLQAKYERELRDILKRRGLLLLYLLDPALARDNMKGLPSVAAFGISFPASGSGVKVKYEVNNVAWEQDYGGAD